MLVSLQPRQGAVDVGSDAVRRIGEATGLDEVTVTAAHGQRIVSRIKEER